MNLFVLANSRKVETPSLVKLLQDFWIVNALITEVNDTFFFSFFSDFQGEVGGNAPDAQCTIRSLPQNEVLPLRTRSTASHHLPHESDLSPHSSSAFPLTRCKTGWLNTLPGCQRKEQHPARSLRATLVGLKCSR